MELVVITKHRGPRFRMKLGALVIGAVSVFFTGAVAVGAYAGFHYASSDVDVLVADAESAGLRRVSSEISDQRGRLEELKREEERALNALTARLGQLQAEVTRLNAVASRVVDVAGLDPDEFALLEGAAVGGPVDKEAAPAGWQELTEDMARIEQAFDFEFERLEAFDQLLQAQDLSAQIVPAGRPVREGWISSGYGRRADPMSGKRTFHHGIDFAGKPGTDVVAVAAGVVTWSGKKSGYGNLVEILHGDGFITRYGHNKKNLVAVGERVERNQTIAELGSSGRATGPHVHFEVVQNDKTVNPWKFIQAQQASAPAADAKAEG